MRYRTGCFEPEIRFYFSKDDLWMQIPEDVMEPEGFFYRYGSAVFSCIFMEVDDRLIYTMSFDADFETQLRMELTFPGETDLYPVLPCILYGDNHADEAKPGEFPLLTNKLPGYAFSSDRFEFRADRAAVPMAAMCTSRGALACMIEPYSTVNEKVHDQDYIRNGILAFLPDGIGVSLGYTNTPVTMLNRSVPSPSMQDRAHCASVSGALYWEKGDRRALHPLVKKIYEQITERPVYTKTAEAALEGLLDSFCGVNYDAQKGEYTNRNCLPPKDTELRPWRAVTEIGWTGGGIMAFPFAAAKVLLPEKIVSSAFSNAPDYVWILDRIAAGYRDSSGFLNDLMAENNEGSPVNGWWTYYGLTKDCHCAYTQGSAVYYLLETWKFASEHHLIAHDIWKETALKVLDTVCDLQGEDGSFGYTYALDQKQVLDWNGFAGCWFVPSLVMAFNMEKKVRYLDSAKKAHHFYAQAVKQLDVWGSPMDTWKAVDEEGNLAFLRASRLLYELTGEDAYLENWKDSANYEFLWRYSYRTKPTYMPIKEGWNACGGSVTSVSNPHIHPMGVLADDDLRALSRVTGDSYYAERAEDSFAWLMQTLELYPEKTGYGRYGVLSERWCPSDGLTVQRNSDGEGYSSWYSYNLWAAANAMEAVCRKLLAAKELV